MQKKETFIKKLLKWFDTNILTILSGLLIIFIPLYPKLPLFEAIPGYIVRVRLEDIFVLITVLIWFVQLIRKKVSYKTPLTRLIVIYISVAFLSILSAVFIIKTLPTELIHIGKTTLHFVRYIEYFSLFFILFSSIKSLKNTKILMTIFTITIFLVTVYGYGQKYFYWPVYSTMNREFSKGMTLYLTEHARVQSTFGGHYDLAAYLVIVLPIILALAYKTQKITLKILLHLTQAVGLWLLIMTASRTSFGAYLAGVGLVVLFSSLDREKCREKLKFIFSRGITLMLLTIFIMVFFGADMYERYAQVLENNSTFKFIKQKEEEIGNSVLIALGIKEIKPPENSISLAEVEQIALAKSDERPTTQKPSDVYVDVPDKVSVATTSAEGETTTITVDRDRTWSDNALKYGLSTAIRLDTLWPNAIKGFLKNPLLGSGYATLNKETAYHFTEAESTDNNFLRTLGETGLLGFLSFYGLIIIVIKKGWQKIKSKDKFISALSIGLIAASIGLLINATYIDVFASSKVAFTYWAVVGLVLGSYFITDKRLIKK